MQRMAGTWAPLALAGLALALPVEAQGSDLAAAAADAAEAQLKEGLATEALPYAIASVKVGGDARANDLLAQLGEARVVMDFGRADLPNLSGDGSTLVFANEYWRFDGDQPKRFPLKFEYMVGGAEYVLSENGAVLAFFWSGGVGALFHLTPEGARQAPPQPGFRMPLAVSADGRLLLALDEVYHAKLWRIGPDSMTPLDTDFRVAAQNKDMWAMSADGGAIVARSGDSGAALFHIDDEAGVTKVSEIGDHGPYLISGDGGVLASFGAQNEWRLWRREGASLATPPTPLGPLIEPQMSADGTILIDGGFNKVTIRRIAADGIRVDPTQASNVLSYKLSANGRVLLANGAQVSRVWRIGTDGTTMERLALPRIGSDWNWSISNDGQRIAIVGYDRNGVLYDIGVRAWTGKAPRGTALANAVCRLNGDFVRPLRVNAEQNAPLAATVRGRLHNPCDWRGVFAIFPSEARGDAWFEGYRQWRRLVAVRESRAEAPVCEDTTFGASEETKATRKRMCDLYARAEQ